MQQHAPLDVGNRKQLFLDNQFFAASRGVTLTVDPPVDAGEALRADRPWESGGIISWLDVVADREAGHVKLYYLAWTKLPHAADGTPRTRYCLCCAVSADGVEWEKPSLGVCEFNGSIDNNIVMLGDPDGPRHSFHEPGSVVIDPNDVPERRYKMLYNGTPDGFFGAYSADGFRWTVGNNEEPISKAVADSQNVALWDGRLNRWVGYFRLWAPTRCVCRVETDDFWNWPFLCPENVVLRPDELDTPEGGKLDGPFWGYREGTDKHLNGRRYDPEAPDDEIVWFTDREEDLDGVDFYNQPVVRYPYAADAYVMPFSAFYHQADLLDIHLAVSRDGIHWERPGDRQPWIRLPMDEEGIHTMYAGPGVVRHGDRLYHYHSRKEAWHGGAPPGARERLPEREYDGSIRRVTLRLDGYVSAAAGSGGAEFVTPPLRYDGSRLELNVDTSAGGQVEVGLALLEKDGPAFAPSRQDLPAAACDRIVCNSTHRVVTWKGNRDVSSLAGKLVRMHVRMRNAKLYAFQFAGDR